MNSTLQREFDKIDKRKSRLLARLDKIDDDYLTVQVEEGSWSVVQVLRHVSLSEEMSLQYIKKKISAGVLMPDSSSFDRFKMRLVNWYLISGLKYKAPTVLPKPEDKLNYQDVCIDWYNTRKALAEFLNNYPDRFLSKAIFKHPIVGRTDIKSMLVFFNAHLKHHEYQIKRVLDKILIP
ncbi:DinB family protein [Marinoscillum sp. MHG1-6]|uniref:DinB family protein n=1 Tax=Marinoscillum sp. MHG1-6 TaxID=2959627 RepID=UPI002158582C|nr:DinB family protein [Marinoscillum sp. MHG1-6]